MPPTASTFVLLHIICTVFADETVFTSIPTTVKTTEHDTVLLPCQVTELGEGIVRWWKGDLLVADSTKSVTSPSNVVLHANHSLEVSDVSSSDSGDYRCQVTRPHPWNPIDQHHSIVVLYPPSLKTVPESGLVEVEMFKPITIGCHPYGYPKPTLKWMFKGREIKQLNMRNTLSFTATEKAMEGEYVCIADNGVGDPALASITLKLIYAPEVEISRNWIHTAPGLRTEITCRVLANPPAQIEWFKDEIPIPTGYRVVLMNLGEKQMLIIKNTRVIDFGLYTCRATNSLGSALSTATVSGIPNTAVFKKGFKNYADNNFTLVWEVESYSPIIQHKLIFRRHPFHRKPDNWTKLIIPADAYSPGPFHTQVFTITGLSKESVYETVVTARNKYGWSQPSQVMKFSTSGVELPEDEVTTMSTDQNSITEEMSGNASFILFKDENFADLNAQTFNGVAKLVPNKYWIFFILWPRLIHLFTK